MKSYIYTALVSVLSVLCSCSSSDQAPRDVTTITIDIDSAVDTLKSPLIDTTNFSIVPLETSPECIIGEVTRVFLKNDKIYVYDRMSKGVYIFDKNGSYLSKIHSVGAGPMEYLDASDVFVSEKTIILVDYYSRKVFIYDTDGKYLKDFSMEKFWANAVFNVADRIYYANCGSRTNSGFYALFSTDTDGNDLQKYIPFEEGINTVINDPYCYSVIGDKASLMVSATDTIYSIHKSGVHPEYVLDFMGKRLPQEYRKDNIIELMKKGIDKKYVLDIEVMSETDKYIFLEFGHEMQTYYLMYDKASSTSIIVKNVMPKGLFGVGVNFKRVQNNKIITYSETDGLLMFYKNYIENPNSQDTKFKREMSKVLKNKSTEDNPVLFIFDLK